MPTVAHAGVVRPLIEALRDPDARREQLIHLLLDCLDSAMNELGTVLEYEGDRVTQAWELIYLEVHTAIFFGYERCEHCHESHMIDVQLRNGGHRNGKTDH
jgi:hypothetical protein